MIVMLATPTALLSRMDISTPPPSLQRDFRLAPTSLPSTPTVPPALPTLSRQRSVKRPNSSPSPSPPRHKRQNVQDQDTCFLDSDITPSTSQNISPLADPSIPRFLPFKLPFNLPHRSTWPAQRSERPQSSQSASSQTGNSQSSHPTPPWTDNPSSYTNTQSPSTFHSDTGDNSQSHVNDPLAARAPYMSKVMW
jgi:hypothetical protein